MNPNYMNTFKAIHDCHSKLVGEHVSETMSWILICAVANSKRFNASRTGVELRVHHNGIVKQELVLMELAVTEYI